MTALFSISCPTCQARLAVRSAVVIGQILQCPKCGGMVKVDPPPDWDDPEADQDTVEEIDEGVSPRDSLDSEEPKGIAPVLPSESWESEAVRSRRRHLAMGLVIGMALICAVLLGWRLVQRRAGSPTEDGLAAAQKPHRQRQEAEESPDGDAGDAANKPVPGDADQPAGRQPDAGQEGGEPAAAGDGEGDDEPHADVPQEPDPATKALESESPARPEGGDTAGSGDGKTPPADAPPGLKPAKESRQAEEAATTALEKLEAMINPSEEHPDGEKLAGEDPESKRPPPRRERNVAALLTTSVERLTLTDFPLIQLPNLVYGISGVPVTLDLDSLSAANISLHTRLQGTFESTSLNRVLDQLLSPLQLEREITAGGLRVLAPHDGPFAVRYRLDQLPGGSGQARRLVDCLPRWLPSIDWKNERVSLRVEGPHLVVVQTAEAHAKMRAFQALYLWHRGQQPHSNADLPEPLDRSVSFVVIEPTSLYTVLRQLSDIVGVDIVVDWESAAAVGCEPDVQLTLELYQRPFADVLTRVLADSDLAFRVVDKRTIAVRGTGGMDGVRIHRLADAWGQGEELSGRVTALIQQLDPNGDRGVWFDSAWRLLVVPGDDRFQAQVSRLLATVPASNSGGRTP